MSGVVNSIMGNHIYKSILKENAEDFFNKFIRHSRTRNTNPDTKRITHTGMFGTERERIAMSFLGLLSPATISLANNAKLITPFEGESTECDIVLYDNYNNPIIKSDEYKYIPNRDRILGSRSQINVN